MISPFSHNSNQEGTRRVTATLADVLDTNINSTSSFFYDPPGSGMKSTQQLNVDWSKFQNHTFFNSAEAKTNVAFERVINGFPFDGTRQEVEIFFERLTGFERWVYDNFSKSTSYLKFSGSAGPSGGSYIQVKELIGTSNPTLSSDRSALNALDPRNSSFSVEMWLNAPAQANGTQVLCQKLSSDLNGFTIFVSQSADSTACPIGFAVISGSATLFAATQLPKGDFKHLCFVFDKSPWKNDISIFVDEKLVAVSTNSFSMGDLGTSGVPLIIGSGSAFNFVTGGIAQTFTPTETLSGSIDEFRFFHVPRTLEQQKAFARKSIYAQDGLKLYFKFNEPSGTLISPNADSIVIDSSGNQLHSNIENFDYSLRNTGSVVSPVSYENASLSPVLFPAFEHTVAFNVDLLQSASAFDSENKNLITKLIPSHYFEDGKIFEGLETSEGTIGDKFSGQLGAAQLLSSFLYVWAKFFDEMKLFVDTFAGINYVGYNDRETAPDLFLPWLIKSYGFSVPSFFGDASIDQFINAQNIQNDFGTNEHALQYVQNQIHRRILANMLDIVKSKGTLHSIKAFIRSVGIDPDISFRIREFGGPTRRQLGSLRETRSETHYSVDFRDGTGLLTSPALYSRRVEPGFPEAEYNLQFLSASIDPGANNGVLTSGSFTLEALYRFPLGKKTPVHATQSLARFYVDELGFEGNPFHRATLVNIIATSGTFGFDKPTVKVYAAPSNESVPPLMKMQLLGVDIFDGDRWNVSFGRIRNDAFGSVASSSYYLRVGKEQEGDVVASGVTSSYFQETITGSNLLSILPFVSASEFVEGYGSEFFGASTFGSGDLFSSELGPRFEIGNGAAPIPTTYVTGLNITSIAPDEARYNGFQGQVSLIRFWSKDFTEVEWREHVRNYKTLGVSDPNVNFNFVNMRSGSFERLRIDAACEQLTHDSDGDGDIVIYDLSQNSAHLSGSGFAPSSRVMLPDIFRYGLISPAIDEACTQNKVRPRSFLSFDNVKNYDFASLGPIYEPDPSEPPSDDTRLSIEFSIVDALNRDIINIFSTLDSLESALGDPETMFEDSYQGLESMRDVYFNRLTSKINFRGFFEFFKWFDSSVGEFITQLIPAQTRFYGTNFIVESHMLERARVRYFHYVNYLGPENRIATDRDILLQQITGSIKKF